jgi:hypothetical protein
LKTLSKRDLAIRVIHGAREYCIGTVLFHQAVGQLLGVNLTDMKYLDIMPLKGSASPSELAEHTGLSTGATTAMLDRLEEAKLIERRPTRLTAAPRSSSYRGRPCASCPRCLNRWPRPWKHWSWVTRRKELKVLVDFFAKVDVLSKEEREKLQTRYGGREREGRRPSR